VSTKVSVNCVTAYGGPAAAVVAFNFAPPPEALLLHALRVTASAVRRHTTTGTFFRIVSS
jgi:hypothetical protein